MNWEELVRQLMERIGLRTDKELAKFLGVTPGAISKWRKGETQLGPVTKLIILDKLAYFSWSGQALEIVLGEERGQKIMQAEAERARNNAGINANLSILNSNADQPQQAPRAPLEEEHGSNN